jgi:hypothetical protein
MPDLMPDLMPAPMPAHEWPDLFASNEDKNRLIAAQKMIAMALDIL